MNELLEDSLKGLHQHGAHHVGLLQSDPSIQDYYAARQHMLAQQAQDIEQAIQQIEHKYQQALWQLDQEYGVYVNMITPSGD